MKNPFRLPLCVALALSALSFSALAAEVSPVTKTGYTVMVEIKVSEEGKPESVKLVGSEDTSAGEILTKMAVAMALKTQLPLRQKEGKPVKYTARVPFYFPIEGDEGPAADLAPKAHPRKETAVMPAYPTELRSQGVVGGAILELVIDAQGQLAKLTTLRASHPEFEAAARAALEKWTFVAAQKDGQPVESRQRLAIVFETEETMADVRWRVAPRPSLGSFVVIRPSTPIADPDATEPAAPATAK